jgi:hypothetical protein
MMIFRVTATLAGALALGLGAAALGQGGHPRDIGGTWTITFAAGGNPDGPADARDPAPPPLKPEYREIWAAREAAVRAANERGQPLPTAATFCLPQGMPAMMGGGGPFPMEVLLSDGQVTIIQEAYNQVRRIYLDRPQLPPAEIEPGYFGRSVGHWEGNTLVVSTIGIKESVEYRNVPHSPEMRITERIRLIAPDRLRDEITIEDPAVLEEPWTFSFEFDRLPGYEIMEYVCEDNREYVDETGATRLRVD